MPIKVVAAFDNADLALDMGVVTQDFRFGHTMLPQAEADDVVSTIAVFLRHLLAGEISLGRKHTGGLPFCFAGLLVDDKKDNLGLRMWLRQLWAAVVSARLAALEDRWLQQFLNEMVWPQAPWCNEIIIALQENGWDDLPSALKTEVAHAFSDAGTKDIEDTGNVLRDQCRLSKSGRLAAAAAYHTQINCAVLPDSDKPFVQVEPIDKHNALAAIPPEAFSVKQGMEFSLGSASLDTFMERTSTAPSPMAFMRIPVRNSALIHCERDYEKLRKFGASHIFVPGTCIMRADEVLEADCYWVLESSQFGVTAWEATIDMYAGRYLANLSQDKRRCERLLHIDDPSEWVVFDCFGASPGRLRDAPAAAKCLLCASGKYEPAKELAALRAFYHMNAQEMLAFAKLMEIGDAPYPTDANGLAVLLIKSVFPLIAAEALATALAWRPSKKQKGDSLVDDNPELVSGILDDDERKAVESKKKVRDVPSRQPPQEGEAKACAPAPAPAPGPSGAASSEAASSSSTAIVAASASGAVERKKLANRGDGGASLTLAEVRALLPIEKGCTAGEKTNSWIVKYLQKPEPPRSNTQTWSGPYATQTKRQAALEALRWAWIAHEALGKPACPHDLT